MMNRQKTFANASTFDKIQEAHKAGKVPYGNGAGRSLKELHALIDPFYPKAGKGRPR